MVGGDIYLAKWIIAHAGFDPGFYLQNYPDVAANGIEPALHYVTRGAWEGRDPSQKFSTARYLREYPEVARDGVNPLVHYHTVGRHIGYQSWPSNGCHPVKPGQLDEVVVRDFLPQHDIHAST